MLFKSLRVVALLVALPFVSRAENPVSVQVSPVAPAAVSELTSEKPRAFSIHGQPVTLGALTNGAALAEFPAGFTPTYSTVLEDMFFVMSTASDGSTHIFSYTAKTGWTPLPAPPGKLYAAAKAVGQAHVLFLSDAIPGELDLVAYHTITSTWASFGKTRYDGALVAVQPATAGFVITTRDAAGKTSTERLQLVSAKRGLRTIDYVIIVVYLAIVAGIGLYFYLTSKKDTANFFVAGRKIPWWAAGLSLYATGTSAISYLAIPAKSYATNWLYLGQNVITFIGTVYVAYAVVPIVRRLNLMSVYEYLELRFHPTVRMLASLICIVQHLAGRMSVVLLLPALALSAVTGIGVTTSILIMGVITTVYTVLGGMKAVIWTDVLQVFVMVGGALFAMGWMIHRSGGLSEVTHIALSNHKTHLFDWSFDFTMPNAWIFVMILILGTLTWPQDQVMVQRVLSTKDINAARGSVLTLTAIALPGTFMFFGLGTLLYTYYKAHPAGLNPLLTTDQIFPQFIAAELPAGVTGLIIAGIFAASMATLSSNINSIATLLSVDFYERYVKGATTEKSIRIAEYSTIVTGAVGTGLALYLSGQDISSLWDKFIELWSLLGGGFAGIYALGMFTRRTNWQGAVIGIIASILCTLAVKLFTPLHVLLYAVVSSGSCILFGWFGSYLFPPPARSLAGLTVFDQIKNPKTETDSA